MQNPLLLTIFIVGASLFILCYLVSALFYRKRHETKYHFYSMFPYEFNYPHVFKDNLYGNILFGASCFSIATFYILNPISSLYTYISLGLGIIITMLFLCLLLMPLQYLRTHIALSTVAMTLSVALPLFNLLNALDQMKISNNKALCIVSMVISGLLAASMLILILNPKMTYKIYYEKETTPEGKEIMKRPKIIPVALSEWWSIFTFIASPLAILFLFI